MAANTSLEFYFNDGSCHSFLDLFLVWCCFRAWCARISSLFIRLHLCWLSMLPRRILPTIDLVGKHALFGIFYFVGFGLERMGDVDAKQ
ncbi:unnamed protein product [Lactuca virosa]|uniref:Uncharacterized protein n=1 Tax=Lactuca virosa TaxID=75947 RepID=A0AAU9PJQ7_9ASTR|nr:unnamed protein product [Lactuca virosa]